jgi:hypothetical protein
MYFPEISLWSQFLYYGQINILSKEAEQAVFRPGPGQMAKEKYRQMCSVKSLTPGAFLP